MRFSLRHTGYITVLISWLLGCTAVASAQALLGVADSIRQQYHIPELALAVVSSDRVLELQVVGCQRANAAYKAQRTDRFHLGSNTKAVTALIAALLVQRGQIKWDTQFFSLYPALRPSSRPLYRSITLQDLLTFRARLPAYTYSFAQPNERSITGNATEQRLKLARYFLAQKPMPVRNGLSLSNAGYVLAGLMLERASGQSFQTLVGELEACCQGHFKVGYPNASDSLQPWGHDQRLIPQPPAYYPKLNWLLAAGNLQTSLPDYAHFVQFQLQGLLGQTKPLSAQTFTKLMFGLPTFSFGWFCRQDKRTGYHIASNTGNAGAFITRVEVVKELDRAYIIFTNAATAQTQVGVEALLAYLHTHYGH